VGLSVGREILGRMVGKQGAIRFLSVCPLSTPNSKIEDVLTTKYVLPRGRTEKRYEDVLSGGKETGLYSFVAVRFWTRPFTSGHSLYSPSPSVQRQCVCGPSFAAL